MDISKKGDKGGKEARRAAMKPYASGVRVCVRVVAHASICRHAVSDGCRETGDRRREAGDRRAVVSCGRALDEFKREVEGLLEKVAGDDAHGASTLDISISERHTMNKDPRVA